MGLLAPPITDYDDLTTTQVIARLGELSPAELRRVAEYERRNGNRLRVLAAVEHALAQPPAAPARERRFPPRPRA